MFSGGYLFSQQDVSIGNITIVGGEPLCPTSSVKFQVEISVTGAPNNDVDGDAFYFQVNGPIARAAANYTIDGSAHPSGNGVIANGATKTFIFPDHFDSVAGSSMATLNLSDPSAPYTITASITIPADPDISNNVSTSLDIGVYTPVVPSLSSNDGDNVICAGEEITFTITPFSGTATYTFKVNNGIIQSLAGVNTITFSSLGGLGSIANGDKVTFDMIDANGCITNSSTQSITVSVSSNPSAGLSASASDGLFCSGDTINFTATGGVSYTWYINGSLQFGATFPNLSRVLSNNDVVTVRVFNASGCYDEESLTFNEMTLDNNGLIVLQNASDSNICSGAAPTGQILGDGSGGSLVASSTYGSISYQWQSSTNGGSNFFDINGANSANYQPAGISTTTLFRRNVIISSDTTSCTFIGDDIVTINKRNTFDINLSTNDSSDTFCQDQNIIVSANTGAATYTFIVNGTTISANTTTNTLNLRSGATRNLAASPPIIQNGDTVTVQITDNFGCTNQQTIPIIIDDVGLNPGVSTNAPGNIICLGENIEIEATGGVSYTFFINNTGSPALPAEVVGNKFTTNRLSDGDIVISRVFNATGCYIDVNEIFTVLSISTTGSITLQNGADANVCYNTSMSGGIDGGTAGVGGGAAITSIASATIAYQWQSSVSGGPWGDIAGAISQSYSPTTNFTAQTRFKRIAFTYYDANSNGIFDEAISCSRTDSNIVTVNAKANFDVSLVTGVEDNSYCVGDLITINAPAGADTYQFFKNDVSLGAASPSRTVTATAGNGGTNFNNGDRIRVQVTADGCTFSDEITILVDFFGVVASASISSNAPNETICSGDSIRITAGPPAPGYTYTFTLNGANANPAQVAANVLTTTGITTDTVVLVTVTNASGCSDTASLTVKVPSISSAGQVSIDFADLVLCAGSLIATDISDTASATVAGSAGTVATYQWQSRVSVAAGWQNIAGATSNIFDVSVTPFTVTEDIEIRRLTFASLNNVHCPTGGSPSNVISINVEDDRNPVVTVNPSNTVCAEDVAGLTFTANITDGVGTDTYQWSKNGTAIVGATNTTYSPGLGDIVDGDVITFQVSTTLPDQCSFTSNNVSMNVSDAPTATVSSSANANTICSGDSVVITAGVVAGASYAFRLNGAPANASHVAANVYTVPAGLITSQATVTVVVTNGGGCDATAELTVFVPEFVSAGQVSIDFADLVLCAGSLIATDISDTASATVAGSAGTVATYQWQSRVSVAAGWQNIAGATSNIFDVSVTPFTVTEDIEIRRLTFASLNNVHCPTGGSPSNVISINVEDDRNPVVTVNPSNTVCAEDVAGLTFTANITDGVGTDTYQWSKNGTAIVGATNTTYSPGLGDIVDGDVITFQVSTTLPDQCSFTSNNVSMNVSDAPAAATVSSSANANTICSGDSVVITAGVVAGASYAFRLNGAPANASHVAANVYTVPAGLITSQATVTVVVTNGGGCDATAELTVFVPEFVSAGQVSIDFADLVLCAGSLIATDISDTASATVAGSAGTVATYQWQSRVSVAAGWQNIAGATSNIFDVSVTPFTVTEDIEIRRLTFASLNNVHCPTGGSPSNVISINVEDDRNPVVTVNPSNTVCAEDVAGLTFTANITDGVGTDTYQWSKNGTAIVGATNTTYSPGLGDIVDGDVITFQVSTTLPDQCSFTSNNVSMNVSDAPAAATVSSSANANTICSGDSVVITAGVVAGASYAFRLNGAPANASHVAANVYTVPAGLITSQATVTVVVTNGGGCDATAELTVFVPEFVSAGQVSIDFADLVLCAGSLIATDISDTASATVAGSAGTVATYQWQSRVSVAAGWQNIAGATSNIFDVSVTPFTVTEDIEIRRLTFASLNNVHCPTGGSPSNVISINVEDDRNPVVTVNPSNTVCAEDVAGLTFTANITDGVGTDTYQWSKNGTAIVGATNTTYSPGLGDIVDGDVITFQVSTTLPDQCSFTSNNVSMNVSDAPAAATVSSSANANTICSGDSVVITAGVVAGASYAFRLNGAPANASHVAANVYTVPAGLITSQATVTVVVTNGGGCDATAELTVFVPEFVSAGQVSIDFADLVLCAGSLIATDISDTASATVAGSAGTVATYQWQSRVSVAAGWQNIAGATSNIFDVSVTPFTVTEDIEIRRLTFASLNNVHCPTGGSPSNVISINVEDDRNPVVTVNPSNTVCAEDVAGLTFTANITDGVGTDTYQWSKNGTAIVGATNTTYSPGLGDIVDGDVITFQVSTTLPDQCSFTSNNVSMNVSDAPAAATVSSSANANTICSGDSVVITAGVVAGASYAFRLNGAPANASHVAANVYTVPAGLITSQATVTVVVTNGGGCDATAELTVFVPEFVSAGQVSIDFADLVLCAGSLIATDISDTASATVAGSAGTVATYQWQSRVSIAAGWQNIAGATSNIFDVSVTPFTVTEDIEIRRLTFASLNNVHCPTGGSPSNVISINVEDDRNPVVTVNPSNTVCGTDSVTFQLNVTDGVGTDTYQWSKNGTAIVGATNQIYIAGPGSIIDGDVITAQVSTTLPDQCSFTSNSVIMNVNDAPAATISSTAVANTICGGVTGGTPYADTVTFTANFIAGASYQFFNGAGAALSANQAGVNTFATDDFSIYDTNLQFTIRVRITNSAGCFSDASMNINLNYVTADAISISGGAVTQNVCSGTAPSSFVSLGSEDAPDGANDYSDGADHPQGSVISYRWQNKTGAGNWQDISSTNSRTYQAPIVYQTTQYRRKSFSDLNGVVCEAVSSNIITINVAADLTGGNVQRNINPVTNTWVDQDEIICVGDTPQELRVINSTGGAGTQFQWQYSLDNLNWEDITRANGFATDAIAAQYQPSAITATNLSSVSSFTITNYGNANEAGDIYRVTLGADSFSVTVGEVFDAAAVGSGVSPVSTVDEVLALLEYKINQSGSGITAVDNAATDNIQIILAPGSLLVPTYLISDVSVGANETIANSANGITYNALGSTRYYRRVMTQSFGGAILPVCQTFSDIHSVEVSSVIAGKVSNTNLVICNNTAPTAFSSLRNANAINIGATLVYQWYRTTDANRTVWAVIPGANLATLNFGTALTQSTSFKRRVTSTYSATTCFSETDPVTISVLDQINTGFILANQSICRVAGAPLTVDVADLVNIVANSPETDDGIGDGIAYHWQFSSDNLNWDDITAGSRADLLNGGFAATLSQTTVITAAQIDTDIERRLQKLIDPDIPTIVYYRLKTTRFNDANNNNVLDVGEVSCEVLSAATQVSVSEQPTLVQTTAPLGGQTVCTGTAIAPITFQYGGSATAIRLVNTPGGLNVVTNAVSKTITLSGIPTGTGFIRVTTTGTTCEILTLQHLVRVTTAPEIPDYILIDDAAGGTDPIPIVNGQDGNIYNGQTYLCEQALAVSPGTRIFSACYNDGRVAPLTESYNWFISPPAAGTISRTTGFTTWNDGFFGDATIQVVAVGCDGSATATLTTVVTVNQFNSSASNPTEPVPLLEAESEIIYLRENAGNIRSQERYNITLNGVRYTYETRDTNVPADGIANQSAADIASALTALINDDLTSPVAGLFGAVSGTFNPGDANNNGLNDDVGGIVRITAQYAGNSAPVIPPGTPRGSGGNMSITFSVTKSPVEGRAFGSMFGFETNPTSEVICGVSTGAEPICETTALTPNTQYFSTASNYSSIRYAISNVVAGPGSVASPGSFINSNTIDWNAGFHGTFNVDSYATGCDGIENATPGVHTVRIYQNLPAPLDINYNPLTLPNCPAGSGESTQFTSSSNVTWSWNNESAGTLDSVTGLVSWTTGWSGTVVITATSFGCGDGSISRTVIVPDSPSFTRISGPATTNQSLCIGGNIAPIKYEILGGATGADVTGIDDLNLFEQLTSENQVDRFVITGLMADAGDIYTLTIDQVPYTVTISETATAAGGAGVVDTLEEVVQVFVYKINQAALGITAVNDGPAGQFTLTSNNFDFNVSTSFNDALGDDGVISFNRTVIADGGTFIEISGTISGSLGITVPTTYQYTITTTGGTCTPTTAQGFISVSPNSSMTMQAGMNSSQTVCNNSIGAVTPIVYNLTNASTVNVAWTPSRPTGINHTHVIQNQISTIALGGVNGNVAANNGEDYTITINSITVTYTINTGAPQNDNEIVDILNGLRSLIAGTGLLVDVVVVGGNSLRITSRNGTPFTISSTDPGINAAVFTAPSIVQSATNSLTLFGNPAVVGLAVDTVYGFTITTVNNAFGCNNPADQVSLTGSITIAPEAAINLTTGSNNLTICQGETVSSTQGGVDIEWDITGYALGATIGTGQLPQGVNSSYTEIPQITEITFAGNPANFDDTDIYRITVNGVINSFTVNSGAVSSTFASILQQFETLIDSNVPQVDASYADNTLTIQSNTGDAVSVSRLFVNTTGDAGDPTLNAPNVTQVNRKFIRIFGAPTDPAAIYPYTITTFGPSCDPSTANGTIRVVDTPTISVAPGSDANPSQLCNKSPMTDIDFNISTFATYAVTWTGALGPPAGISLVRTTSSTISLISDPVINIPGAIPAGGVSYTYQIISTVNDNGCSSVATFTGIVNIINGTATLDLNDASSLTDDRVNANGGVFNPSVAPDYVLIEACQGSLIDDSLFDATVDITNVAIAAGGNLPSGLSGDFTPGVGGAVGQYRIYGTPDTATTEDIVLQAITDACVPAADIRVRIVVYPNSTITLDGGSNDNQTVCNNTALTNISYTLVGALDATIAGLPNGLVGNTQAPNKFIISGTPSVNISVTTSYTYTITTTSNPGGPLVGACAETTITGVVTVRPDESLTVTSGAIAQQVCFGENITPIVISVVGENTFGSVANPATLPAGMNFTFVEDADNMGGIVTISGSPSAAIAGNNPFTYSFVTTTGGVNTSACADATQQIDITVVPPSSLAFSGPDAAIINQTVCAGTLINEIEFTMGGGSSNVSVTFGAGLGFSRAANVRVNDPSDSPDNIVIFGTAPNALVQTTYNYEISTVNQCNPGTNEISVAGTITVIPTETIIRRGGSGATTQNVCVNQSVTPMIFDVTGQNTHAKFVDASKVPSGISLDFAPDQATGNGGVATILGSPDSTNAAGDYTFQITTGVSGAVSNTSQCADQTQLITITVKPLPTMVFSGADPAAMNQSVCQETAITPIQFTLGGGANDVTFSSSPAGLGFTRAANISVDGNSVQIFGNAPVVGAETTFTYSISTVNPNSCTPSVTLGGSITVFPPVQYNNWAGNHTINNPLCSDDGGSIVVNAAAVTGGFVAVKQQSTVELNNSFAVGNIITINVGPQPFAYTVQGVDNPTGNLSNNPAVYDRAQSKSEIITAIVGLINDANSGSTLVTAIANSPSVGITTLIAKTSGIGFTLSGTKQPGNSPGTITIANPVPNQSLTYGYYWRQTNSIGTPVTTLDITDSNTYVDTGLTLNLNSVTGSEYYMLTTVSNNCQADAPFVTITAPDPLALTITTICDTEITANGSGGTGQLTYILYNSGGTEIGRSPATFGSHTFSDGDANNIPGGGTVNITPGFQYQIGIKDANNCSLNGNDSTVQINTPLALVIDQNKITVTPPGCAGNDGSIQLDTGGFTITGGSAGNTGDYSNLTFLWTRSGGGTFNTQDIFGLSPADYTLTVTDNLCNTLFITSNPITLIDTADFTVTNAVDNSSVANCSDGNLQVSVAGGSGNFSFAWTDQFGVSRGTTNRIENLDAGIYTLIVRDTTTGCEQTFTYTITGSSGPLQALNEIAVGQANFTTTDILCNGAANGAFTVEFTGGNPPYSYSLNGAAYVANGFTTSTSSVTSGGASATVVSFTTQILSLDGLEGGTYSVKIKDSGLCLDDSGNIVELNLGSVTINEPDPLKIELNASTTEPIDCSAGIQGSLGVNITGGTVSGTTPYSILWELFGPSGEVLYKRTTSGSPSDPDDLTITGLDYAGDYTVTVTDGAGCSTTEVITLDDGSNEDPFTVGETPAVTQPGCNSEELGTIELNLSGGVQPYNIKWYKLSVAQDSAVSSTASSSTASSSTSTPTSSSTTIEFSDGGYVSMNKDGFYLIDNLQPGKYRAIVTDATGCKIFSRSGLIKNSSFNMINQRVYNREILDCETGLVEADFSFRLSGTSLAYNIYLDGNLIYGGTSGSSSGTSSGTSTSSSTFTNNIVKQGNNFIIRNLTEGRHVVEAQDAANIECSLDYAFDVETYVPITYEGETEFEFDVCESGFQFELDTSFIIGGNPIIDDNDNVIYNLRWTYTPSDPNEPGSSFVGRTSFVAGRGTYQLIISDGTCASDPIDFVFSGDIDVLSIDGLLVDASGNNVNVQGVSCELGAQDGRISIQITGGQEPYNISWEIFDATSPVITPVSSTLSSTSSQINSPWKPLNGSYPGLGNFDGFTTLNELPAGLFRYTVRSGSTCPNPVDTPFNYLRDVISVDDDNTLVITDGPYVDPKLCEGLPGLLILDAVNNSDSSADLNFFYIDTKGTEDIGDDGVPVALNGNTTKLDEDTYQILIDTPFEYGKLVITTDEGCGVESEFNLALGDPYFSYTSPSFEQVNEIPARETVTFIDESEGEFSKLEWNFGDNSEIEVINISGTVSGVTQVSHAYGNSGTYYPTLTIYNEIGCYESVTNPITIGRGYSIYTPNVFTPNNDCLNDYFRPLFTGFESLTFNVYDNRGNLIYTEQAQDGSIDRSECPNQIDSSGNGKAILGWNGKRVDNSTLDAFSPYYVYSISGVPLNRVNDDQVIKRSGIFTILK